jgi:hypothetical protein
MQSKPYTLEDIFIYIFREIRDHRKILTFGELNGHSFSSIENQGQN